MAALNPYMLANAAVKESYSLQKVAALRRNRRCQHVCPCIG